MAVMVTGGAGFIGSHVCERLLKDGHSVICVDDFNDSYDPSIKKSNIVQAQASPQYYLEECSITDATALSNIFDRYHITEVIHLAARAGVRASVAEPLLYEQVNVQGTLHLLELCRRHNVARFIFGSSSSVYGTQALEPFHEDDAADRPISPYASTKRAAELMCHSYHHLYGLPVTSLRFFTVYGPRQRPDLAIHKFTRALYEGRDITLYGDGRSARDYTYVDDVVNAITAALNRQPALGYEVLNLGSSTPVTLRELVALLERFTGRTALIRRVEEQPGDVPFTYADTSKARALLNWQPSFSFEEGIRRFIAWYERSILALEFVNNPSEIA